MDRNFTQKKYKLKLIYIDWGKWWCFEASLLGLVLFGNSFIIINITVNKTYWMIPSSKRPSEFFWRCLKPRIDTFPYQPCRDPIFEDLSPMFDFWPLLCAQDLTNQIRYYPYTCNVFRIEQKRRKCFVTKLTATLYASRRNDESASNKPIPSFFSSKIKSFWWNRQYLLPFFFHFYPPVISQRRKRHTLGWIRIRRGGLKNI